MRARPLTNAENAKLIAELQGVSIAIRMFGLRSLPDVMVRIPDVARPAASQAAPSRARV